MTDKFFCYEVYIKRLEEPINTDSFEDWVEIWPDGYSESLGTRYLATGEFVDSIDTYTGFLSTHSFEAKALD